MAKSMEETEKSMFGRTSVAADAPPRTASTADGSQAPIAPDKIGHFALDDRGSSQVEDGRLRSRHATDPKVHKRLLNQISKEDTDCLKKMSIHRFMALVSMAFLWTSAQVPLYLYASVPLQIYEDIGGLNKWIWYITANLLGLAAVCPFVGAVSDLFGRRYVAIAGCLTIIVGQGVCAGANSMDAFIAGMAITGAGAGVNELTALAGTAELAPVRSRGTYIAVLILSLVPFVPSALYAQLIAANCNWRYISVLTGTWTLLGLAITTWFYLPPPRTNSRGLSKREILKRVDWIGGILSVLGITLFCVGLNWGGYMYAWNSSPVLAPLLIGIVVLMVFVLYERFAAPYPLMPRHMGKAPRTLSLLLFICFISGAQFFSVQMMWPPESYNVYDHDPIGIGLRSMPFGAGLIVGAAVTLVLFSKFRRGRWLLFAATCVMTAGCGSLAAIRPDNVQTAYALVFLAGLGVGGVVSPSSIMAQIVCPDEIIATITSLTLAIRVVGGAVGWAIYYNIFALKLAPLLAEMVPRAAAMNGIHDPQLIGEIVGLTAGSMLNRIEAIPEVTPAAYAAIVVASQEAYALAYPWVYYCSIAFGGAAIVASYFVEEVTPFMDDHVAVVMR